LACRSLGCVAAFVRRGPPGARETWEASSRPGETVHLSGQTLPATHRSYGHRGRPRTVSRKGLHPERGACGASPTTDRHLRSAIGPSVRSLAQHHVGLTERRRALRVEPLASSRRPARRERCRALPPGLQDWVLRRRTSAHTDAEARAATVHKRDCRRSACTCHPHLWPAKQHARSRHCWLGLVNPR